MAARSTSRFKQKPAVPFGDFMLPILGVVALGLIIFAVRLLWASNTPSGAKAPQPRQSQSIRVSQPKPSTLRTEKSERAEKLEAVEKSEEAQLSGRKTVVDDVIAQPLQKDADEPVAKASAASRGDLAEERVADRGSVIRLQPKRPDGAPPAAVRGGSIDGSLFVVQCGSYTEISAANSVVADLKSIGYTAVVRRAEVRGRTYFRVIVAGGRDRAVADEIARRIKAAGHPVLVRRNQ